jgi:transposase
VKAGAEDVGFPRFKGFGRYDERGERLHLCPHCGLVLGRDKNAAINMLARGLEQLRL